MRFNNYIEIANELQERATVAIRTIGFDTQFGCSNVSCSRYIEVFMNETVFKLRFSDHADRYGADHTIRFDYDVSEIEDEFGDKEYEISENAIDRMVAESVEVIVIATKLEG